jgi:hypothetical protein
MQKSTNKSSLGNSTLSFFLTRGLTISLNTIKNAMHKQEVINAAIFVVLMLENI